MSDLPPQAPSLDDDEDEFDTDHDEASRGLLSSTHDHDEASKGFFLAVPRSHGPSYSAWYLEPIGRI